MAVSTRSELWRRATAVIPGGVNSPVRAMRAVGLEEPVFMRRGEGAYIEDVDGNRYVDWVMSWGPLIFGHADPETVAAVVEAAAHGTTFGAPTEAEVELAAEIADGVPSIEQVRLVSSGTEAAMSAVRLARAATGRDRDPEVRGLLPRPRRRAARRRGLRRRHARHPVHAGRARRRRRRHDRLPVQRRRRGGGGLHPLRRGPGVRARRAGGREHGRRPARARLPRGTALALRRLRLAARLRRGDHGLSRRAWRRAGAVRRTPDLTVLGKIVGGGLPLAAFGGRAELMEQLAPAGDVYQAGTLSGNPLATAAGLSVLRRLRERGRLRRARAPGGAAGGRAGAVRPRPARRLDADALHGVRPCTNCNDAPACDAERYGALFRSLLADGVYVAPSQYEAMFVSLAHGEEEIDRTIEAAGRFFAR